MKKLSKKEIVSNINEMYKNNLYSFIIDYKGVSAADIASLRGSLRKIGLKFFVVKNSLNRKGMEGTNFSDNSCFLKGQCGVVFCNDLTDVSKVINNFCFITKKAKFISCLNGKVICSEDEIRELASLPSIEEIRVKLLYMLNSVGSKFVRTLDEAVNSGRKNCPVDAD